MSVDNSRPITGPPIGDIIDHKAAADALRHLADKMDTGAYRLTSMDYNCYDGSKKETLRLAWEPRPIP